MYWYNSVLRQAKDKASPANVLYTYIRRMTTDTPYNTKRIPYSSKFSGRKGICEAASGQVYYVWPVRTVTDISNRPDVVEMEFRNM
ncbi:hypothetical protein GJ496_006792 [Pomphorhynchus laevis]|nr:hypothetical protein GJ496_006792 [Pomphorhynchus laevis]